ncbi:MAG: putative photosynthetic complex assembly protein PuhE [Pseudomonadota bacterium]
MIAAAIFFALFLWWFSTGVILAAVSRAGQMEGRGGFIALTLMTLPVLIGGGALYLRTLEELSLTAAFTGFAAALAIWGWIELAFLTGAITGPDRRSCPPGADGLTRFGYGLRAIQYHELALLLAVALLTVVSSGAPNQVGYWTFLILFFARVSAKLNLFLGVPNINVEFLPRPVQHLQTYFGPARTNRLFPFTVTALTLALGCWVERAVARADDPVALTGFTLLSTLTALAVLEHWLMVVKLPDAALWRWMIKDRRSTYETSGIRIPTDG